MLMLIKHPEIKQKILDELDSEIIQPHLSELVAAGKMTRGGTVSDLDVLNLLNFDNQGGLDYYTFCHNESLRMQPPVYFSSSINMMKDCQCDYVKVLADHPISIDIYRLHHNPNEWQEPARFIPERFDSRSPYFLTPNGKPRNPFSFFPFLGGQRICIGKTFIEAVSKFTVPSLISNFDMEFLEGVDPAKFELPFNNMISTFVLRNDIYITLKQRTYSHKA